MPNLERFTMLARIVELVDPQLNWLTSLTIYLFGFSGMGVNVYSKAGNLPGCGAASTLL